MSLKEKINSKLHYFSVNLRVINICLFKTDRERVHNALYLLALQDFILLLTDVKHEQYNSFLIDSII